jgi:hypothetical protein
MPRATDRLANDSSLGKRAAIVCTDGSDREQLALAAGDQHRLVADVAKHSAALLKLGERHAFAEIRTRQFS